MAITQYQLVLDSFLAQKAKNYKTSDMKGLLIDLQANILKSHRKKYVVHAFIHLYPNEVDKAKAWLRKLDISSALAQLEERYNSKKNKSQKNTDILTNIYLSHDGYEYLGYDLRKFPESGAMPFSGNPQSRTALNLNMEEGKLPYHNKIHLLLTFAGNSKKQLREVLKDSLEEADIKAYNNNKKEFPPVKRRIGHAFIQWGESKEVGPFGFTDKTSNPLFFPNPQKTEDPKSSNFISDDDISALSTVLVKDPNGDNWNSCGSFLAFMKLRQDVKAFKKASKKIEKTTESDADFAKGLIMGKLPNDIVKGDVYLSQNKGCPMHKSHIEAAKMGSKSYAPITRRSINYRDSKDNQGLLFMSFQANIKYQFENLISRFITNRSELMVDPLLYDHGLKPSIDFHFPTKDRNDSIVQFETPFVTLQKGWYFFAPSISSIKKI